MNTIFEVHWEPWFCLYPHSSFWKENDSLIEEPTYYLLDLLRRHQIKATWYRLGWLEDKEKNLSDLIEKEGHEIGYHSYYHVHDPTDSRMDGRPYRFPRWCGEKRLFSGGFFFRFMSYGWLKKEALKKGIFFVHPHDLLFEHPKLLHPWENWYRSVGLKTARDKLERLCREVDFRR